jgi:hypothetical protein
MYSANLEQLLQSLKDDKPPLIPQSNTDGGSNLLEMLTAGSADLSKLVMDNTVRERANSNGVGVIQKESSPKVAVNTPIPFNYNNGSKDMAKYFASTAAKKIVFVAPHFQEYTEDAKVSWNILKVLSECRDFEVHHYATQKINTIKEEFRECPANIKVTTVDSNTDNGFGYSNIKEYIEKIGPDVVVILGSLIQTIEYVNQLKTCNDSVYSRIRTIAFIKMIHTTILPHQVNFLNAAVDYLFVSNELWRDVLIDNGMKKPVGIFAPGFDSKTYTITTKSAARKALNLPTTSFIILVSSINKRYTRFDLIVSAFAELVSRHQNKDIFLFCITENRDNGYDIQNIYVTELKKRGIPIERFSQKILITNDIKYSDEIMNYCYLASDISLDVSETPTFGLTQIEMLGLYRPIVVIDKIAYRSFANESNSITVPIKYTYYSNNNDTEATIEIDGVLWQDVANAVEKYLLDSSLVKSHGENGRRAVISQSWKTNAKYFIKCLREI